MTTFPTLVRATSPSGEARYSLGDPLVDLYLEFVAGRVRPNTLRAVAFDLKTFFTVVTKDPVDVVPADIFEFLADQRGDRSVIRLSDGESGMSARTIARRLVVGVGLLLLRDRPGRHRGANEPGPERSFHSSPGRQNTNRPAGACAAHIAEDPLARRGRCAPRRRCAPIATGPWSSRWCSVVCAVAKSSAFVSPTSASPNARCSSPREKVDDQRITPISNVFFSEVGDYLRTERPANAPTDRVFVALKGPSRGHGLSAPREWT